MTSRIKPLKTFARESNDNSDLLAMSQSPRNNDLLLMK